MEQSTGIRQVTEDITLTLVSAEGEGDAVSLNAELAYDADDPFAVSVTFKTAVPVVWTFAYDLLAEGVYTPVGDGDIHVWPCLDTEGRATVIIELCSPDGELLVQAPTRQVVEFLSRSAAAVTDDAVATSLDAELGLILGA